MSSLYEGQCPNWNPAASQILYEDWPFPIFLVDEHDKVEKLLDCYAKRNKPNEVGGHHYQNLSYNRSEAGNHFKN